jgi:hypothetical protein
MQSGNVLYWRSTKVPNQVTSSFDNGIDHKVWHVHILIYETIYFEVWRSTKVNQVYNIYIYCW